MYGLVEKMFGSDDGGAQSISGSFIYAVFRVIFGLLFMAHGAQKILGLFGGTNGTGATPPLASIFGMAGMIELFGGLLIVLGIFTRFAAIVAAVEMVFAYFMVHFPVGLNPLLNKGELVVLYFGAFLLMARLGSGRFSLEWGILRKEVF